LTQDPQRRTLFVLVGHEGLFCGVSTPQTCGGFHPGGSVYIRQQGADGISRAGAKLAEALLMLQLDGLDPVRCHEWIELGASPGGMTRELLDRGCRVTAIDRAPLDPRLMPSPSLRFIHGDAASVPAPNKTSADALLCDMNDDPEAAMCTTARMADALKPGSPVIFTLKLTAASDCDVVFTMIDRVVRMATDAALQLVRVTHLNHNRQELTLILQRQHLSPSLTA
jgi:23S rRNA C2498 (ribose-2'-O)-methylase RlmM